LNMVEGPASDTLTLCHGEYNVAILEDEDSIRQMLKLEMEELGFIVFDFNCVERFLESVDKINFGLVISDINLSEKTGVDLLKILNQKGSLAHMQMVLTTGGSLDQINEENQMLISELGIRVCFKPFTIEELLSNIDYTPTIKKAATP
jgi:DNA-binding response OmpR family regulator